MRELWDWAGENAWSVWLALALVLGGAELLSLDLILLMVAIGAVVGMGAALAGADVWLQIIAAAASSAAMLAFVRPSFVKRLHSGPELRHGPAALIGEEGFAIADVDARSGLVKLRGEVWTARPYDESEVITTGAKVQVLEIRGATAYVVEVPQLGS
jgi:membrane protein implicated in regulation of membrane protease activity